MHLQFIISVMYVGVHGRQGYKTSLAYPRLVQ